MSSTTQRASLELASQNKDAANLVALGMFRHGLEVGQA
jgi:hypothetical protein